MILLSARLNHHWADRFVAEYVALSVLYDMLCIVSNSLPVPGACLFVASCVVKQKDVSPLVFLFFRLD